jgi:hypothetical protein
MSISHDEVAMNARLRATVLEMVERGAVATGDQVPLVQDAQ